jgi:hypothetical protein
MAWRIGDVAWLLFQFPALSAYKITGAKWTITFVGTRESSLKQVCHLFFEEEFDQEQLGEISLWKLSAQSQKWLSEDVDLVICELGRLYPYRPKAAINFTIPILINQIINIPEKVETILKGGKFKEIRRIVNKGKRLGFKYRFSQSLADFDNFYYNMYLPFIKSRHGDLATITPYEIQRRWFNRGGVLLVTQHDKPIAGVLCCRGKDTYYSIELGILDACPKLFQLGTSSILKWHEITWAQDQGAKTFNMGSTSAWCSNPVFTFKRRWGARVVRRQRIYGTLTILGSRLSARLRNHLNRLEFITEVDGKFYRVLLASENSSGTETVVNKKLLAAKKEGLDGLLVLSTDSQPVIYSLCAKSFTA